MPDRLALIIANSEYDDPKLSQLVTPSRDAEALAQVLSNPDIGGFDVTLRVNETMPVVGREIARLYQRKKKGDLLLLYYSGHGIQDDYGDLYLAVKDTETDIVSATAINAAFVRDQLDKSSSQRKVVVLDCCHSGAFARGAKAALGSSVGMQEAFAGSGYGRVVLTASNAVEFAWEGDKLLGEAETSVFTHFLVQGLQTGAADSTGDGQISLDELYDYVYEQVVTSGKSKQTPQKWAQKVEGQIIIAHSPTSPAPKVSLPGWITEALASSAYSVRLAAVGELDRLSQSEDQALAAVARAELERLSREDENSVVRGAAAGALGVSLPAVPAKPTPAPAPLVKVEKPPPDVLVITSPIYLELVRVPAGEFLMGSDPAKDKDAQDNEQPQHRVYVSEFYIGKYPVTNTQYATFIKTTSHRAPKHWEGGKIPSGEEKHPAVNVSWHDAVAFCQWLSRETGKAFRLLTEAEWEKAARGTDGRVYPWGNTWDKTKLNSREGGPGNTTPVGQYSPSGDSPYGLADMSGNVWEWCADRFDEKEYQRHARSTVKEPQGPEKGALRVLRGGAFYYEASRARCAFRYSHYPNDRGRRGGFRVGWTAPSTLGSESLSL